MVWWREVDGATGFNGVLDDSGYRGESMQSINFASRVCNEFAQSSLQRGHAFRIRIERRKKSFQFESLLYHEMLFNPTHTVEINSSIRHYIFPPDPVIEPYREPSIYSSFPSQHE